MRGTLTEKILADHLVDGDMEVGGEIGIHGNGADSDWTLGCIALADRDIEELFMLLDLKTPVTIKHE